MTMQQISAKKSKSIDPIKDDKKTNPILLLFNWFHNAKIEGVFDSSCQ